MMGDFSLKRWLYGLLNGLGWLFLTANLNAGDHILSYHSDIVVNQDTTLSVVETIVVDVRGGDISHGIFRDFPRVYKDKYGLMRKRGFEVISVTLNNGPVEYAVEKLKRGSRVKVGSANVWLTPREYTYRIAYRTTRQLGYFDDYDELYWNVTGNGWKFPIRKVTATVTLPEGVSDLEKFAWTGVVGSTIQ